MLQTFSQQEAFLNTAVQQMYDSYIAASDVCTFAFSGGSTPEPIYHAFAEQVEKKQDKKQIHIYQVDERIVALEDPQSNAHMIRETMDGFLDDESVSFFPMYSSTAVSIDAAQISYAQRLTELKKEQEYLFDVVILGMGADGHTASLFPHSPAVSMTNQLVAHTQTHQFAVRDRLTLTFPAIFSSKKILLLLNGKEKKDVLDRLLHGNESVEELPAKRLFEHKNLYILFCET